MNENEFINDPINEKEDHSMYADDPSFHELIANVEYLAMMMGVDL